MSTKIDLTGKVFGRLKVLEEAGRDHHGQVMWKCQCSCEKQTICYVRGRDLRSGGTKSCGCYNVERSTKTIREQTRDHSNINSIRSKKLSKLNTTGVRGVCPTKQGKFRAYIGYKGKNIYLGEYETKELAVEARKAGEEKYFKPLLEEADTSNQDNLEKEI